jgi:Domain of unknown function (DUF4189)
MLRKSTIVGIVLAVGAMATTAAVAKDKEYAVGAIAVDLAKADRDPAYGIGGGDTEDEANKNAMKFCAEAGGKACKTVVTYPECGAYAAGKKGGGWGMNTTKATAEAKAMSGCDEDSCKIVVSDCN